MKKITLIFMIMLFLVGCKNDNYYKDYFIHEAEHIEKDHPYYRLKNIYDPYYTDITVYLHSDSTYQMIVWGDRESWKWIHKLDRNFVVSIPYNKYKEKDVSRDRAVIKALQ